MKCLAIALLVTSLAGIVHATPTQDLDKGRDAYKAQDWDVAYKTVNALLYPNVELARQEDVWEAYVILGASAYQLGNRVRAIDEFEKALRIDAERTITTNTHRAEVVQLYEDTKDKFKERLAIEAERKRQADQRQRIEDYLKTIGVYETNSFGVNFIPFGVGQFQNKQPRKGYLFLGGQVLTGGASLVTFVYLAGKYGLSSNQVPLLDGPRVRQLQQLEIGTGIAFIALYGWGVVDAMINYRATRLVKGDDSLLPQDVLDGTSPIPKAPPKKTSLRDRLRIGPILTPTGVGIGLGWEND